MGDVWNIALVKQKIQTLTKPTCATLLDYIPLHSSIWCPAHRLNHDVLHKYKHFHIFFYNFLALCSVCSNKVNKKNGKTVIDRSSEPVINEIQEVQHHPQVQSSGECSIPIHRLMKIHYSICLPTISIRPNIPSQGNISSVGDIVDCKSSM